MEKLRSEGQPTSAELATWRQRWNAVSPAAVAVALSSTAQNLLIDGSTPNFRSYAQAWLNDNQRRATIRESRVRWPARLTWARTVTSSIAAIIAATPVARGWFGW